MPLVPPAGLRRLAFLRWQGPFFALRWLQAFDQLLDGAGIYAVSLGEFSGLAHHVLPRHGAAPGDGGVDGGVSSGGAVVLIPPGARPAVGSACWSVALPAQAAGP